MTGLIVAVIFGVVVMFISIYGYKISAKTAEDYFVVNRALGIVVMFFFIFFGLVSAWTFLVYPGTMYVQGPGFAYFGWGIICGYVVLLIFIAPRLWAVTRLNRFLTPIEAMGARFESPALKLVLAIPLILFLIPYIGIQPLGVGLAVKAVAGPEIAQFLHRVGLHSLAENPQGPVYLGAFYVIILMLTTVLFGGMRAVAWVNILLGTIFIFSDAGSVIWAVVRNLPGGLPEAASRLQATNPAQLGVPGPLGIYTIPFILGSGISGMCCMCFPHIHIGLMASRDKEVFKWLALLFLVLGGSIFVLPALWPLIAPAIVPGLTGKTADAAVMIIVKETLPSWFAILFLFGVISAALSTVSLQLMGAGILISRDIIWGFFKRDATDRQIVQWTRITMLILVLLSFLASMLFPAQAAFFLIFAVGGMFLWLPALWYGFLWKRTTKAGAMAGPIAGLVYMIVGYGWAWTTGVSVDQSPLFSFMYMAPPVLLGLVVTPLVSLFTKPASEGAINMFFDEVEEYLEAGG